VYANEVQKAQKLVAALIKQGVSRAPKSKNPTASASEKQPRRRKGKGGKGVRKEASEEEQGLVADDAQFVDDGVTWQVHSTRWQEKEGVTLLYYDVERVKLRLQSEEDELEDAEDLLSDDEDVERSSPEEVRKWVDDYAAAKAAASQLA
jgi:hypothetical protein